MAARVAAMRLLGVQRWGELELGTAPVQPRAAANPMGAEEQERARRAYTTSRVRTALRSSGIVPPDEWFDRFAERVPMEQIK